jgi:hypothetical protein
VDQQQGEELTQNPSESLALEIKTWIDPDSPEGRAKIVKSCIALRNHDGGRLLIGFNNDTGEPEVNTLLQDVEASFHIDNIQGMVTKHASEAFEVEVRWIRGGGKSYPLIVVPTGVKSPVAVRSPIVDTQKNITLLEQDCVYVRSLKSNNTPATTRATWRDWPDLIARCFENREADIGRFVRRHFTPENLQHLRETLGSAQSEPPPPSLHEQAMAFLEESAARFEAVASALPQPLPPCGAWEVAAVASEPVQKQTTNMTFLNLITSKNPKYTGWPLWMNSRNSPPRVVAGAWEELINSQLLGHIDFWRASGEGKYYHRRAFEDDTSALASRRQAPTPGTVLDLGLVIYRTAEAIAVALAFIEAMGDTSEETQVAFCFRWRGLKNRTASSWANPDRLLWDAYVAHDDELTTSIVVPLAAAKSSIPAYTYEIVRKVFAIFDGLEISPEIVADMVNRMLTRRW